MRIALIGHACGPHLGSEPGNTWNLAQHLSEHHHVWVLTHPQHQSSIDAFMLANPNPLLQFVYIRLDPAIETWEPARGEKGLRKHYLRWQKPAAEAARSLCRTNGIEIIHHFSLGTIKAPPHLQDMPVPIVWGPMGGGQVMPLAFRKYFAGHLSEELARIALAKVLPMLPAVRKMARRARVVLGNNQETIDLLKKAGASHAAYCLETALPTSAIQSVAAGHSEQRLIVLWAGRVETRKALPLALEAMALTKADVKLMIAGDGPDQAKCESLANELRVTDRVKFLGRLPFVEMAELFRTADVLLFTSLRDSTGAVVLEAMAKGLPVVTLNHQGMRLMVPDDAGVKVPVVSPQQVARDLAAAMDRLATSPNERAALAAGALRCAAANTWIQRASEITARYQSALQPLATG